MNIKDSENLKYRQILLNPKRYQAIWAMNLSKNININSYNNKVLNFDIIISSKTIK